jgi:hypothetical protein
MGMTGYSELYAEYLKDNGVAREDANGNEIKENVKCSQCWCPKTKLDTANTTYERNIGQ